MTSGRQHQRRASTTIGFVLGVRYWLVSAGLLAMLLAASIFFGAWGWLIAGIPIAAVTMHLRHEHYIARYNQDAEDHPMDDLPPDEQPMEQSPEPE